MASKVKFRIYIFLCYPTFLSIVSFVLCLTFKPTLSPFWNIIRDLPQVQLVRFFNERLIKFSLSSSSMSSFCCIFSNSEKRSVHVFIISLFSFRSPFFYFYTYPFLKDVLSWTSLPPCKSSCFLCSSFMFLYFPSDCYQTFFFSLSKAFQFLFS